MRSEYDVAKEAAILAKQKKKEAEKARREYDEQQAEFGKQRKEARAKAIQQGKDTLIKGQESSIAVAKMKDAQEDDELAPSGIGDGECTVHDCKLHRRQGKR